MHPQPCRRARCLWHPEYLFEAVLLGTFMVAALAFTVFVQHPDSPVRMAIAPDIARRLLIGLGLLMGAINGTLVVVGIFLVLRGALFIASGWALRGAERELAAAG